jgi:hypothetical protein
MQEMGIPQQLITWTDHFMTGRQIALAFDGEEEKLKPVETGIPQGSPTSPILFIIYLQPLFTQLEKSGLPIRTPSYMDDVAITTSSKSFQANIRTLESAAAIAFEWAINNAVTFDDAKSELIHFHRQRTTTDQTSQQLQLPHGTKVQPKPTLRWLGVWLDSKLSFKEQKQLTPQENRKIEKSHFSQQPRIRSRQFKNDYTRRIETNKTSPFPKDLTHF